MNDPILLSFLERQHEEALSLAELSDLIDLVPVGPKPYGRWIASFRCKGLVETRGGITEADYFAVGISFSPDYLRRADPAEVLTWLEPFNIYHPNIRFPFICLGPITPGTTLVDILYRCYEIISYQNVTMIEGEAFNKPACAWARKNQSRFPVDRRPLKSRRSDIKTDETAKQQEKKQ